MFTAAVLIVSLSQCGYEWPNWNHYPPHWRGVWVWFYADNPVEQAKAELRASRPQSRDHQPPPDVMESLEFLDSRRAQLYANLLAAPPEQKSDLRRQWLQAREDLDKARLAASRRLQ